MARSGASSPEVARIRAAIDNLAKSFAADGYLLAVEGFEKGRLSVRIEAGPEACAECLIPESMTTELIRTDLPDDIRVDSIDLRYPDVGG